MSLFHRMLRTWCLSIICFGIATTLHSDATQQNAVQEPAAIPGAAPVQLAQPTTPATLPSITLPPVPQDSTVHPVVPVARQKNSSVSQPNEKKDIYLNFENSDLSNFIDYIAELKKLNILPDKSVEGSKISLTIREPLSITGAWNVFITVLEMSGFSIVQAGLVHKVVPKDKKIQQPLPAFINTPFDKLPDNDLTIRYVFFLSNIPTTDVQPLLESMLSQPNAIYENKEMNAFVITDKALNIRAAVKLLHELDSMGMPESVAVLRLKRINAADAKTLLDALIRKPDTNPLARLLGKTTEGSTEYFSPTTRVIVEERSNSLILLGTKASMDKVINFITNHIDTDLKAAKSPLHIYELQHVDASHVKELLTQVTTMPESATGQVAGKYGAIRGGVKYFKNMSFNVDKDGNRLIANCPDPQDWELVKKTIIDFDKPQPQVAIESMIVSISATDVDNLGGAIRNKKHGQIGKNIDFQSASYAQAPSLELDPSSNPISLLGNMLGQITAAQGSTILTFGKQTIWAALNALKTQQNSSILSQPFITIANKTQGIITVGQTKRVSYEDQGTGSSTVQSFKSIDANTCVKITPQINLDGIIRMDVDINIKDFADASGDNTTTQALVSKVTIADGQVLALGGFVKTSASEDIAETPILSKIPILGWLFKGKDRTITKQYIFIFLAPTIVKPRDLPGMNLYTKMKLHDATECIENAVETKRTVDPVHNWYFNANKENYSHKVIDFANARYQPTTVDIKNDAYYRSEVEDELGNDTPMREQPSLQETPVIPSEHMQVAPITSQIPTPTAPIHNTAEKSATLVVNALPPPPMPIPPTPEQISAVPNKDQLTVEAIGSEKQLDAQRQELRRLLAHPSQETPINNPIEQVMMHQTNEPTADLVIDHHKRNSLKEFLAASPASVQSNINTPALFQGG